MFSRIGERKAKYYGVMDLTSGYHQVEIHPACRFLTAFITLFGLFEWLRVPMGVKGAPSYLQQMMVGVVLAGLLEVYLDDVLVFGNNEDEYIYNLEKVFARFRQYNITLHPDKCRFGLSEVEYVGYVINEKGMSFSQEKIDSVLNFPKPVIMKNLKSFLGLANYFPGQAEKCSCGHYTLCYTIIKNIKRYHGHRAQMRPSRPSRALFITARR